MDSRSSHATYHFLSNMALHCHRNTQQCCNTCRVSTSKWHEPPLTMEHVVWHSHGCRPFWYTVSNHFDSFSFSHTQRTLWENIVYFFLHFWINIFQRICCVLKLYTSEYFQPLHSQELQLTQYMWWFWLEIINHNSKFQV